MRSLGVFRRERSLFAGRFVDRSAKRLQLEVAIVALAIDEKCRSSVHPAAHASRKVPPHTLGKGARSQCLRERLPIQREALGQFTEHLLAQRILVFEDEVVHLPELAVCCGKLSGFGSGLSIRMDFSQRKISKREPQLFSEPLLKGFDDRVCISTVRTELRESRRPQG